MRRLCRMRKRGRKKRPSETLPWVWRRTVPFPPLLSTSLPLWNSRGLELEQSRQRCASNLHLPHLVRVQTDDPNVRFRTTARGSDLAQTVSPVSPLQVLQHNPSPAQLPG